MFESILCIIKRGNNSPSPSQDQGSLHSLFSCSLPTPSSLATADPATHGQGFPTAVAVSTWAPTCSEASPPCSIPTSWVTAETRPNEPRMPQGHRAGRRYSQVSSDRCHTLPSRPLLLQQSARSKHTVSSFPLATGNTDLPCLSLLSQKKDRG